MLSSRETADGPSDEESTSSPRLVIVCSSENSESGSADLQPPISSSFDEALSSTSGGNGEVSSVLDMKAFDGTWNINSTLPFGLGFSTPWRYVHTGSTDNASTASQHPMWSGCVDGAMPSTSHGVLHEALHLPRNDVRLYVPLPPTQMPEESGTTLFKTMGGRGNISVPGTSSAPVQQQNAT
ncbi:hypothetical protein MTO96_028704 [Rhipicephalus appendiculatus]